MSPRFLPLLLTFALLPGVARADDLFTRRVAPLLETRCVRCHDAAKKRGGLDLSTRAGLLAGGENGTALAAQADRSRLLQLVTGPSPRMPRSGPKLGADEVAVLRRWIDGGASWPDGVTLTARGGAAEDTWWSLRSLHRPAVPDVKDRTWSRTPIDAFVLAALEQRGLRPSPEADRRTLIRRLSFDLTGLPPTPDEMDDFLNDNRPDAYEKLVNRLLASPAHGERWGRHWLDVVHYGDTHGYDKDKRRDAAWPYRDWVVSALNAGLPYRDFVRQQLAGDVLKPGDATGIVATGFVVAGPWDFVGHVELREGTVDKEKTRLLDRDDMVTNAVGTFLSLTIGCARCHDHKFDPIPTKDYYRLQAVFAGVDRGPRILSGSEPSRSNGWHSGILPTADAVRWVQVDLGTVMPLDEARLFPARPTDFADTPGFGFPRRFKVEVSDDSEFKQAHVVADHTAADFANPGDKPYVVSLKGQRARFLRVTATRLWKRSNDYVFALSEVEIGSAGKNVARGKAVTSFDSIEAGRWSRRYLVDGFTSRDRLPLPKEAKPGKFAQVYAVVPIPPRPVFVLHRGDVEQRKGPATPGALACVEGPSPDFALEGKSEGERRLALANWIADDRNPLTWRSVANRVWHYHFGKGLVDTPNDFGKMGGLPTHPELLDWLAVEMREQGSLKHLHRLIVTSAAYRQASHHNEAAAKVDSDNRYLWRMNRPRLDAESVRDAVLAVSGKLDRTMGGPGFEPFRFKDDHSPIYDHSDAEAIHRPATYRRTVYRFTVRSVPNPLLDCLDSADPNLPTPVRNTTLTALQALTLMNNPFAVRQAGYFAERLRAHSEEAERQIEYGYRLAFGRPPSGEERRAVAEYAREHGLAAACRVLLNANEFVFVD